MSPGIWKPVVIDVLIPAGAIALIRMFVFTYSIARERVSCTTAPFDMQ